MKKLITLVILLTTLSAEATIWITLSDPASQKIAVVGASSGYIGDYRTMVAVDNKGIAVVGSWYLGKKQKHLTRILSDESLSAKEMAAEFSQLINQDSKKRRVSLVNARFENASEPGRGCHSHNYFCGKFENPDFSITGGGLVSENVIKTAAAILQKPEIRRLPIECQLLHGIDAIFHTGGEYKTIQRLAYQVDDVRVDGDNKRFLFFRKGHENSLLTQFESKLRSQGLDCRNM